MSPAYINPIKMWACDPKPYTFVKYEPNSTKIVQKNIEKCDQRTPTLDKSTELYKNVECVRSKSRGIGDPIS